MIPFLELALPGVSINFLKFNVGKSFKFPDFKESNCDLVNTLSAPNVISSSRFFITDLKSLELNTILSITELSTSIFNISNILRRNIFFSTTLSPRNLDLVALNIFEEVDTSLLVDKLVTTRS